MRMKFCVVCRVLCAVEKWSIAMAIESIALAAAAASIPAQARRCYNDAY